MKKYVTINNEKIEVQDFIDCVDEFVITEEEKENNKKFCESIKKRMLNKIISSLQENNNKS